MTKAEARQVARERRLTCDPAVGGRLVSLVAPPAGAVVGGFWPLPGEIDVRALLVALHERGHLVGLPETPARGDVLRFRAWRPGVAMLAGRFGTRYPAGEVLRPDYFLAPLLAFDGDGNRLGYGGGYYDQVFLENPGAYRLGCGFAAQRMARVPVEAHDVRLHGVATEDGVLGFA